MKDIKWYNKIKNPLAREWFRLASEDFYYAKDTFNETENYRMICFICHQVVERYLKGYLQIKQDKTPRIHSLIELLEITAKFNKNFLEFHDNCKALNRYYINTRYPVFWGEIYKKEIAKEAIELTEEIIEFMKKII
ncbi:HEPN domain-containing protein [Patescibacteria group bacterium]|nr:HEPN domain-containing protein [Candidatus Falkowbacteria bacterium]MBU3905494.1 HEPN domain-containing protein [Patescibacteria group bacterium]MBU4014843.1 HEPN domain-containing protein [Patescibacteria group bacterium]MBU4026601.1 HEPN domain-containing protein [Patescibacteria group bacterium]MBU4073500.1 HEPN domain-containing protein [Patescibacteria group bacterium]